MHPVLLVTMYFIDGHGSAWYFVANFASVFLLGVILTVKKLREKALAYIRHQRRMKKSYGLIGLQILLIVVAFISIQWLGKYVFVFVILVVFLNLLRKRPSHFYSLQTKLPTTKIAQLTEGVLEISGLTRAKKTISSPFSATPCIGYIYTIEALQTQTYKGHTEQIYQEIHREQTGYDFEIVDDSGAVIVSFEKLELLAIEATVTEKGNKRHSEIILQEGIEVLLIGEAKLQDSTTTMVYSEEEQLFGIVPIENVDFYNRYTPLRTKLENTYVVFLILTVVILVLSLSVKNVVALWKALAMGITVSVLLFMLLSWIGKKKSAKMHLFFREVFYKLILILILSAMMAFIPLIISALSDLDSYKFFLITMLAIVVSTYFVVRHYLSMKSFFKDWMRLKDIK